VYVLRNKTRLRSDLHRTAVLSEP